MALEIFTGTDLPSLLVSIRETLGPEACVMQVRRRGKTFELIASETAVAGSDPVPAASVAVAEDATPDFHTVLRRELTPPRAEPAPSVVATPQPVPRRAPKREPAREAKAAGAAPRPAFMPKPWAVALIGPTGVGKTTTIAKLATSGDAFGGCRVGLLGLDTYRVGAAEQLGTYGDIADLPCEIVYTAADLPAALRRLQQCEVILIDTPGRGPRHESDAAMIRSWLSDIAPDEVHLVLPSGQLPLVSRRVMRMFGAFRFTHVLASKLDEFPGESAVFDLAAEHGLPMRWITDGQEVPTDLHSAASHLDAALARHGVTEPMERCA